MDAGTQGVGWALVPTKSNLVCVFKSTHPLEAPALTSSLWLHCDLPQNLFWSDAQGMIHYDMPDDMRDHRWVLILHRFRILLVGKVSLFMMLMNTQTEEMLSLESGSLQL